MINPDEIKSKGYTLKSAVAFLREEFDDEGFERVVKALDEESAAIIQGRIIPSEWYPFRVQVALYETMDRVLGRGDLQLCWRVGRFTAEYELSTIHQIIMKLSGTERLMKLSAMMWGRYYNRGKLSVSSSARGSASALVEAFNPISKAFCNDLAGWMQRTMELTGAGDVSVHHTKCILDGFPACEFVGSWA